MQALTKTSRSFALYDPHNDAVKVLISDYRQKSTALAQLAPTTVDVRPFELRYDNHTIYEEQDRERSLAFRLFRDGVRRIRFESGVGWEDMVTLLEVLSVRCNGVRQQEDDLITLLRKAQFRHIEIDSVEGYVPDEETPEHEERAPLMDTAKSAEPVPDWDQPLPVRETESLTFRPIDPKELEALRAEENPNALATQAVRAVFELLQTANSLGDRDCLAQLVPFVEEVQHYLVVEGNINELARLAVVYRDAFGDGRKLPLLAEASSFERVVRMVPEDQDEIPNAFFHLLGAPTPAMMPRALSMLASGASGARRTVLLDVVSRGASVDPTAIVDKLRTAPADVFKDLFAILARVAPEQRIDVAFDLLDHPNPEIQIELVGVIADAQTGLRLARGLHLLMNSEHEAVRIRATLTLGHVGGSKAVPMLVEHIKRRMDCLSIKEAAASGVALGEASPEEALPTLLEWVGMKSALQSVLSRFRKDSPGDRMLAVVTASGLARCGHAKFEVSKCQHALQSLGKRWANDPEIAPIVHNAINTLG